MSLGLAPEHLELVDAVRGWTNRHCDPTVIRAAAEGADCGAAVYASELRPALAELGLFGLHLPESDGGQGFGVAELAVAVEQLGRALLPGAFLPTVLASAVLASAGLASDGLAMDGLASDGLASDGLASDVLASDGLAAAGLASAGPGEGGPRSSAALVAKLADGSLTGTVSLAGGLAGDHAGGQDGGLDGGLAGEGDIAAGGADNGLVVTGESYPVLAGPMADLIIAPVVLADREVWVAFDAADLEVTPLDAVDLTRPLAKIAADHVVVPPDRVLTSLDRTVVTSLAAILFGAEACGLADWAVSTAAEYAKIRHQFGRPIGQFQAVKHRCARMLTLTEQAQATVWDASRSEPGEMRTFAASVASVVALDAAVDATNDCIQTLGGIGYTWEHDAHLYYRRALTLRSLLGPSTRWRTQVASLALANGIEPARVELPEGDAEFRAEVRAELAEISAVPGQERTRRLAAGGWVMPHLPKPWGRGAKPLEQLVIDAELRAAGIRPHNLAIGAWVAPALIQYGTQEQQDRFLPATMRLDYLWCQLFSEPGAGSDLAGLTTRAERVEGGWRITGQKIWTSLAKEAAWGICLARTDPAAPKHEGISYFLVDMHSSGVEVRPLREITGDASFNQVFLDNVFVPDDCLVGAVNGGWRIARTTLANERVSLSSSWTFGAGVTELLEVTKAAVDPPLSDVGKLVCEGRAVELLGLRVTLKQLSGTEPGSTGSVRKLLSMRSAQQIAELCWSMTGENGALGTRGTPKLDRRGASDGAQWARQTLQTRATTIGGGTTDIQLNIIAERMLGLRRDPDPPKP